ncbi:MAG: phosphatidylserine decarboxylase [Betaproteobacteria bacterium]
MSVGAVVLTVVGVGAAFAGGLVLFLRRVWFYRDPLRIPPDDPEAILAPADGKFIYARRFTGGKVFVEKLGKTIPVTEISGTDFGARESGWVMGVYMTPLDVHFNYAPVAGTVSRVVHTPAAVNLPMLDLREYIKLTYLRQAIDLFGRRYHLSNERNTIFIDVDRPCSQGTGAMRGTAGVPGAGRTRIAVVEIADKFVNKIRCFVKEGDILRPGQKLSFIERGSQVDLVIPGDDIEVVARVGQQVYGARTVIARFRDRGYGKGDAKDGGDCGGGGGGADGRSNGGSGRDCDDEGETAGGGRLTQS